MKSYTRNESLSTDNETMQRHGSCLFMMIDWPVRRRVGDIVVSRTDLMSIRSQETVESTIQTNERIELIMHVEIAENISANFIDHDFDTSQYNRR
jgi:hypothetical protein